MDRSLQHSFDAEEVMAYLDGELEPQRAAALAGHLEHCAECQGVAREVRLVSGRMLTFEIEPAPASLAGTAFFSEELQPTVKGTDFRTAIDRDRWNWREFFGRSKVLAVACIVLTVLIVGKSIFGPRFAMLPGSPRATGLSVVVPAPLDRDVKSDIHPYLPIYPVGEKKARGGGGGRESVVGELAAPESIGPMVVQTASLSIVTKNYDEANAAVQKLVAVHGGYIEKLDAKAQSGDSRSLSVALRVPAKELDGLLADLRKLGHVEEESKSNEEVSAEYVDLQARLKVAQATERRLVELLGARTGRLEDVLDVERELARVRSEVESMQGQSALMLHRVSYATVQVELSEEYHQKLQSQSSMGTKLRNALLAGVQNLLDGVVALLIFVLNYGLSILFWLALVIAPVWLIWRRMHTRRAAKSGSTFQTT